MIVYKLTAEQANELQGVEYMKDCYFSPTLDADGNYFISIEEIDQCVNKDFEWINGLEPIKFNPIIADLGLNL
jgi:hypothetical protein